MKTAHLTALLLVASLTVVGAIRCYTCNSIRDDQQWCGVDFKPPFVEVPTQCQANCYKFQAEYYDRGSRKVVVSRGCIEQDPGCQQQNYQGLPGYICICNKEYCNGAPRLSPSLPLLLPFLIPLLTLLLLQ